jgi:hypothetical protein
VAVVRGERVSAIELEAGDECATGAQVTRAAGNQRGLRAFGCEQRHVAREHHDIEAAPEREGREVVLDPLDARRLAACRREHRPIRVHADNLDAATSELDGDATGSASRVEDRRRLECADEVGFAVHVHSGRGEVVEASLVVVAVPLHRSAP